MKGGARGGAAVAVLILVLAAGPAAGAGLRDLQDGWLLPPWRRANHRETTDRTWGTWCAAGAGRLYEMPDLPLQSLEVGIGHGGGGSTWQLRASWQVLGDGIFRADCWALDLGRSAAWRVRLHLARETERLDGQPGPVYEDHALVVGRAHHVADGIRLLADLHLPLTAPLPAAARRVRPVARVRVETVTVGVALAWDRRADGTPLLGGELAVDLAPAAALLLRFDGGAGSLGPGLVVRGKGFLLRTSHVLHPALGVSHRFQMVAGAPPGRSVIPDP